MEGGEGAIMAVELDVYIDEARTPDAAQWQRAIDELGFEVRLDPEWSVDRGGFVPCTFLVEEDASFELDVSDDFDEGRLAPVPPAVGPRRRVFVFLWRGSSWDMCCAVAAAAALVAAFDGVAVNPEENAAMSLDDLRRDYASSLADS